MKTGPIAALTILMLLTVVVAPGAQAAHTTVPGVQAVVVNESTNLINLKWRVSPSDPDQDGGSYTYNVTENNGGTWSNLGSASTLAGYVTGGGFQEVSITTGAGSRIYNITSYDGIDTLDSCTVTIDTTVAGDWDTCGSLTFTWNQVHCLGRTGEEDSGFDTEANLIFDAADSEILFDFTLGNPGHGGKALGGDTGSYELEFTIRADTDGASSQVRGLFSYLDTPVSKGGAGNFKTTGAYLEGISFQMTENGNNWDIELFEHLDGTRYSRLEVSTTTVDPNVATDGKFTVNEYSGIVTFTIGSETFAFAESDMEGALSSSIQSFWLSAHVGAVSFTAPDTYVGRGSNSLCFNTIAAEFGGGRADFIGEGQPLEDFGGQGGRGGSPMFPGMNVTTAASSVGVEQTTLAYALFGFLVLGLAVIGFLIAGVSGAGLGGVISVALGAGWNLIPYWVIVVGFLLSVTILILGGRR